MTRSAILLVSILLGMGVPARSLRAQPAAQPASEQTPPACPPGFRCVKEIEYREQERAVCKQVPIKHSKWVYCSRVDHFCLPVVCRSFFGQHVACETCTDCNGPLVRHQLLKKKVEWESGTRCVVETVKERVPCVVWRLVPSDAAPTLSPLPASVPSLPAKTSSR
jgi:hypothetical protein